jgi:predicted CoA-binding protein
MTAASARTVAVVGAGPERRKFGNKSLRAHRAAGYTVFPVHPSAATVEGLTAYKSVRDIPVDRLDRVTLYLPPAIGLTVLPDIAAKSPGEVWFNPGADGPEVLAEARRLGLNVITGCSIVNLGLSPAMFPDE